MEAQGHGKMLLLSGEKLNYEFLSKNLIDEIILTLEPRIFGTGKSLTAGGGLDADLELINYEKLNDKGTLLLTYKVLRK
jgi:riboflavin biosynthesis pyrimidine reductase